MLGDLNGDHLEDGTSGWIRTTMQHIDYYSISRMLSNSSVYNLDLIGTGATPFGRGIFVSAHAFQYPFDHQKLLCRQSQDGGSI